MKNLTLKQKLFSLSLILFCMFSYSQQIEKCATDKIMALERQKNPILFDQNREQLELFTREFAENRNQTHSKMVTKIPTVIHVIHNGEAVGNYPNISDVQLNSAITNLNNAFQNTSIYAGSTFYNSPMDIEFVLAKVKEDGTATTGIERHDVSGKPYATEYNNNGIKGDNVGVESEILFKDYFWNPQDYMNIWIVKKIDGIDTGTGASGTLGYATLPTTFPGITDGLVCQARAFGYNPAYDSNNPGATPGFDFGSGAAPSSANGTADHEVGHYLNLHHTFNGDNNGTTCPPVSGTIGTDDDGCADIPPHKRTNSVCPADNPTGNSCTGGSNEHIHNFMDYSSDDCFSGFSNDQRTRVHAAVNGPRVGFTTAIGHITPTINTFPVAVTNTPVVTDQSGSNLGIFDVTLNGTSFKSISAYNDGFYINRVASQPTITLVENTAYTITVKVGVGNTVDKELVDVYIDYNNDGSFNTTNERIHQTPGGGGKLNGDIFTINFTTPTAGNFVNSQKLRMRVISDFDNNVDPINNSYTSNIGNIEDYSVVFNPTMSINDNTIDSSKIKIYPNPTNAILNIKNLSNAEIVNISIIDALGRKVNTHLNTHRIPVNKLQNGLYFIQVEFRNSNTITKRFIKQ